MALFILRKLILQTRMCSHPVGLDVWCLVTPFFYYHTSCMRTAKALARLCGCAGSPEPLLVAYVISTMISWAGSNRHTNLLNQLNKCLGFIYVCKNDIFWILCSTCFLCQSNRHCKAEEKNVKTEMFCKQLKVWNFHSHFNTKRIEESVYSFRKLLQDSRSLGPTTVDVTGRFYNWRLYCACLCSLLKLPKYCKKLTCQKGLLACFVFLGGTVSRPLLLH